MKQIPMLVLITLVGSVFVLGGLGMRSNVDDLGLEDRLAVLHPSRSAEYLRLGEELLLFTNDEQSSRLGVELLVRAVVLGERNNQLSVASSACIALSDLATDDRDRRWMWDLAYLIDPTREGEWIQAQKDRVQTQVDEDAERCLYAIRYHQQPSGEELFHDPDVRERILQAGEAAGVSRGELLGLLEREIELGKSDTCRGRLYIAERGAPGRRLTCPDHLRALGMLSNDEDLRVFLRVEMSLSGIQTDSWAGAVSMAKDRAVKLPSVADLAARLGVRSDEVFYREGRWVATP
ncbi:MAG: hypothetical protein ACSHX5_02690 [Phycisphaerales bacterium]